MTLHAISLTPNGHISAEISAKLLSVSRVNLCLSVIMLWVAFSARLTQAQPVERDFDGITFVKIEGGSFDFGSPLDQPLRRLNERQYMVTLDHTFWISKYEVSQGEWMSVMGSNPSTFAGVGPDLTAPVETVSWYQAKAFIDKLNHGAGALYYRLPTEVEWEYVAKAMTTTSWSFGDQAELLELYTLRDEGAQPQRRGLKSSNPWGVYDLYGNVYEWCEDWYQRTRSAVSCPPESGTYKVIRGGSNASESTWLRSSSRNFAHPDRRGYYIGLRLVRVDSPADDPYRPDALCEDDHEPNYAPSADTLPGLVIAELDATLPLYDRGDWSHWIDLDGNCVNTRHEVLAAESLVEASWDADDPCRVEFGQWDDPYTGLTFTVASELDVDHMVPLANAHASGGWRWSAEERRAYANDLTEPPHLIAVQAAANRSKGARGPEAWRPPNLGHHCQYARDWIEIKARWGLTATATEWLALLEMLDTCPNGRPEITDAPEVNEPPPPPAPHPGDVVNCGDFDTYDEAYAWFSQYYDDFGDIANLDSDGDGVPCASLPGAP